MTTPDKHDLAELRKVAEAATKAAPGDWEEDACMDGVYRHSQVLFLNDRGQVVSLCDTLNAYHNLDFDKRRKIGEHIARFDPPTVLALIKRVEDAETERAATQSQADAEAAEVDSLLLRLSATEAERDAAQSALAAAQKRITALMQGGGICGLCNGTGKFKGEDCGACDGVGVPVLSRIASVIEDRDRFDRQRREFSNALAAAQKRIAELEAENFALAAHQCRSPYGDEYGNARCSEIDNLKERLRPFARLGELIEELVAKYPDTQLRGFAEEFRAAARALNKTEKGT